MHVYFGDPQLAPFFQIYIYILAGQYLRDYATVFINIEKLHVSKNELFYFRF